VLQGGACLATSHGLSQAFERRAAGGVLVLTRSRWHGFCNCGCTAAAAAAGAVLRAGGDIIVLGR
jgi:hypothetical protein